jgi:hypothetical protein
MSGSGLIGFSAGADRAPLLRTSQYIKASPKTISGTIAHPGGSMIQLIIFPTQPGSWLRETIKSTSLPKVMSASAPLIAAGMSVAAPASARQCLRSQPNMERTLPQPDRPDRICQSVYSYGRRTADLVQRAVRAGRAGQLRAGGACYIIPDEAGVIEGKEIRADRRPSAHQHGEGRR